MFLTDIALKDLQVTSLTNLLPPTPMQNNHQALEEGDQNRLKSGFRTSMLLHFEVLQKPHTVSQHS